MIKRATKLVAAVNRSDLFLFGGIGLSAFGVHQIYPPAAYIVSGMCFIALAWVTAR